MKNALRRKVLHPSENSYGFLLPRYKLQMYELCHICGINASAEKHIVKNFSSGKVAYELECLNAMISTKYRSN
jgi:hypothetical protein